MVFFFNPSNEKEGSSKTLAYKKKKEVSFNWVPLNEKSFSIIYAIDFRFLPSQSQNGPSSTLKKNFDQVLYLVSPSYQLEEVSLLI